MPPPDGARGLNSGELAPGQCVLTVTAGLLSDDTRLKQLWIDNLRVQYVRASSATLLTWKETYSGTLWLTNTTLAGGGLARGLDIGNRAASFAAGARAATLALVLMSFVLLTAIASFETCSRIAFAL